MHKLIPVVNPNGSDSARLDNTLEFLVMSGMDLPHAIMITIPEPWENNKVISQEKRDFYQYYATMMEPWDGPASIIFTDGDQVGAVLDRNGLRPSRYYITDDDQLILSSEIGVLDIDPTKIVVKERLHPGKMLLVDTIKGKVIADDVVKEKYAEKEPYGEWLDSNLLELKDLKIPNEPVPTYGAEEREKLMKAFGYTFEDIRTAYEAGYTHATHFYNAMPGFHKRREYKYEGTVESIYLLDDMTVEVVADGIHVPPTILRLVYKIKGVERTCLITDALACADSDSKEAFDPRVIIEDGVCKLADHSALAGSVATMDRLIRTVVQKAEIPLEDAVRMASETPARIMGVYDRKGSLQRGKDADIQILDKDLNVRAVWAMGKLVEGTNKLF